MIVKSNGSFPVNKKKVVRSPFFCHFVYTLNCWKHFCADRKVNQCVALKFPLICQESTSF